MARQIDYEKLESIKQSTMALIAENGSQKTTISAVAKHAGVSSGYLYTHFESKEALISELIKDLYKELYDMLINVGKDKQHLEAQIEHFLETLMNMSNVEPIKAKFLVSLAHDKRFIKEFLLEDPHGIIKIFEGVLITGKEEGIFRPDLNREELLLILLNLPTSSMFYGFISDDYLELSKDMRSRIIKLCLNALK